MREKIYPYRGLIGITLMVLAIFIARTVLAANHQMPILFDLFDVLTILGALVILIKGFKDLRRGDWEIAVGLGILVSVLVFSASLFNPYPFFWVVKDRAFQALIRGAFTTLGVLGGLVIMRQGGPIPLHTANADWKNAGRSWLVGVLVGIPLAGVNLLAFTLLQGQTIRWQSLLAAISDALLPGVVEEVIYRFALWGLLWLLMKNSLPRQAVWLSGALATLVHGYAHFHDLFVQAPLVGVGMGLGITIIFGLPPMLLARRRGLEAAIGFHWFVDAVRFLAGF